MFGSSRLRLSGVKVAGDGTTQTLNLSSMKKIDDSYKTETSTSAKVQEANESTID